MYSMSFSPRTATFGSFFAVTARVSIITILLALNLQAVFSIFLHNNTRKENSAHQQQQRKYPFNNIVRIFGVNAWRRSREMVADLPQFCFNKVEKAVEGASKFTSSQCGCYPTYILCYFSLELPLRELLYGLDLSRRRYTTPCILSDSASVNWSWTSCGYFSSCFG